MLAAHYGEERLAITPVKTQNQIGSSLRTWISKKIRARPPTFTVCRLRWKHLETLGKGCKDSGSLWLLLTTTLPLRRLPWHSGFWKTVNQAKRPKYQRISSSLQGIRDPKTNKSEDNTRENHRRFHCNKMRVTTLVCIHPVNQQLSRVQLPNDTYNLGGCPIWSSK